MKGLIQKPKLVCLVVATLVGFGSCSKQMRRDNMDEMEGTRGTMSSCTRLKTFRSVLNKANINNLINNEQCKMECQNSLTPTMRPMSRMMPGMSMIMTPRSTTMNSRTARGCECLCNNLDVADCILQSTAELSPRARMTMTSERVFNEIGSDITLLRNTSTFQECRLTCEYWATGNENDAEMRRTACCCICGNIHSQPTATGNNNICTPFNVPDNCGSQNGRGRMMGKCDCSQTDKYNTAECLRELKISILDYHSLVTSTNADQCEECCSQLLSPERQPRSTPRSGSGFENACCCLCHSIFDIERPTDTVTNTAAATNPPRISKAETTEGSLTTSTQSIVSTTNKIVTTAPNTESATDKTDSGSPAPTTNMETTDSVTVTMTTVKSTTEPTTKELPVTKKTTTEETTTEETTTEETTTEETTTEEQQQQKKQQQKRSLQKRQLRRQPLRR